MYIAVSSQQPTAVQTSNRFTEEEDDQKIDQTDTICEK